MTRVLAGLLVLALSMSLAPASRSDAADPLYPRPKVDLAFNRLYDYPELEAALRKLVAAHPDLLSLSSVGKSVEGRELWCVTVNNPKTGKDLDKPAMYVDGNIHGNEVQAAEACLYTIWYLTENYGRVEKITKLVDERAFYIVPTVNPDGRAWWFTGPNTTNSSRSGKSPVDDDRDGLFDEDGYDDIDGDGQITLMRKKVADGRFKLSPDDPRLLVPVKPGEKGDYELLGNEGIDNDGDGQVNEDAPGGYDMNRNWPADWQPDHLQRGAGDFPLSWPETRATADFILAHPNIAGVQAFHNAAGMILRGPGHPSRQANYPSGDDRVAEEIGANGAKMLPFYRNFVIHKDLYSVHGGFIGWTYEHIGIFSFTNELWNTDQMLGAPAPPGATPGQTLARAVGQDGQEDQLFANDKLLFGASFREWKPAKHPLYGDIEIGGFVKESQRVPPTFMIEELCHRNAAFVLYHADQMPRLEFGEVEVKPVVNDLFTLTATVENTRSIPSIAQQAANHNIGVPDILSLEGNGLTVVAGGRLVNEYSGEIDAVERDPAHLKLNAGVSGHDSVRVRWYVRGKGTATLKHASQKGGTITKQVEVK
ncbi:M14 family metallopeptidase [Tundrisphaera lichenicola]|uniref:M14 family metallopeptidase n=1 Tax=Tundrisphaera lichenicola TaxID=2029860 RepID=UPI003EBCFD31